MTDHANYMTDHANYIAGEFDRLEGSTELRVKVHGDTGETKWLNASFEAVTLLRASLAAESFPEHIAALVDAVAEWRERTGNHDEAADAGDAVVDAAAVVIDLLRKIGR